VVVADWDSWSCADWGFGSTSMTFIKFFPSSGCAHKELASFLSDRFSIQDGI